MVSNQHAQRQCVSCGRSIDWNADICQYCGHDYRSQHVARPTKNNTVLWIVVIVVTIVIVVPIVLSAVLYFMVLGFGGGSSTPAIDVLRKNSIAGGFRIEFTEPTAEVLWGDVSIRLSDSFGRLTSFNPTTEGLISFTPPATQPNQFGAQTLGLLDVWINATDLSGNGKMNTGDYVTLQCTGTEQFSTSMTYTLTLLYMPTGDPMIAYVFTG